MRTLADVARATPPSLWEWFAATASVDSVIQAVGVGTLVVLFATNRIITIGQHNARIKDLTDQQAARVKDLTDHHTRELDEKTHTLERERIAWEARYADLKESRDGYKTAAREERERADRATEAISQIADVLQTNVHVLESIEEATKEAK